MQHCFGYVRVSTTKQRDEGVSLKEQRSAIEGYAAANDLKITRWFTETVTAAKQGRPVFIEMVKLLRNKKADGLVIHKIDRSARNLHDWADLADLADDGITIHIAHEGLDLNSRGGRLSADIQAVVASDYIRNLRQEARKGFYGRLKEGLYPLAAPLGYLNAGKGKPKPIDPERGPLVRQAFELYATGSYGLHALAGEIGKRGLTTRTGRSIGFNALSKVLNNTFYTGLIKIKSTGETFQGVHDPLIEPALFERVQKVLKGKLQTRVIKHGLLFRRLFTCALCGKTLIGERQKKIYVYYRCHTKGCPFKNVREELIDEATRQTLQTLEFVEAEQIELFAAVDRLRKDHEQLSQDRLKILKAKREKTTTRLERLTEAYLDEAMDKASYQEHHQRLLFERAKLDAEITQNDGRITDHLEQAQHYLELAFKALLSYDAGNTDDRRELLQLFTSNRLVKPNHVSVELSKPFHQLACAKGLSKCAPHGGTHRTNALDVDWSRKVATRFYEACLSLDQSTCDALARLRKGRSLKDMSDRIHG